MRTSRLPLVLALIAALPLVACGDRDAPAPGTDATVSTVEVSVTDANILLPATLSDGPTTFAIDNASGTSCTFRMMPTDGGMASGYDEGLDVPATPPGGAGPGSVSPGVTDVPADSTPAPDAMTNAAANTAADADTLTTAPADTAASMTGPTEAPNVVAPRSTETLTLTLRPGTYHATCGAADAAEARRSSVVTVRSTGGEAGASATRPLEPAPADDPTRPDR